MANCTVALSEARTRTSSGSTSSRATAATCGCTVAVEMHCRAVARCCTARITCQLACMEPGLHVQGIGRAHVTPGTLTHVVWVQRQVLRGLAL